MATTRSKKLFSLHYGPFTSYIIALKVMTTDFGTCLHMLNFLHLFSFINSFLVRGKVVTAFQEIINDDFLCDCMQLVGKKGKNKPDIVWLQFQSWSGQNWVCNWSRGHVQLQGLNCAPIQANTYACLEQETLSQSKGPERLPVFPTARMRIFPFFQLKVSLNWSSYICKISIVCTLAICIKLVFIYRSNTLGKCCNLKVLDVEDDW